MLAQGTCGYLEASSTSSSSTAARQARHRRSSWLASSSMPTSGRLITSPISARLLSVRGPHSECMLGGPVPPQQRPPTQPTAARASGLAL